MLLKSNFGAPLLGLAKYVYNDFISWALLGLILQIFYTLDETIELE